MPNDRIPVKGNEHKITRVAFDIFRMNNDPEPLWKIQSDDDGNEFLVRTYTLPEDELSSQSSWNVVTDAKKTNLTISYKGVPIHRLVASDYGANNTNESELLATVIRRKLATDKSFTQKLLKTLPKYKLQAVASSFPELISISEDDERHTRQTVEIPIVERPEIEQEKELYQRHTRPTYEMPTVRPERETSKHIPVSRFPDNGEGKKQEFISSPSFNEAFEKWLKENDI
jgi:hypothetical protein